MDEVLVGTVVASTLRVSVPLILCALAGVLSERSGVIDLGLEGKMLLTAFAAASVGAATGSMALALVAAVAVGVALSMLHAYACVTHGGDQVVLGVAITMMAAGLSVVLGIAWFKLGGQTPPLSEAVRLHPLFAGIAAARRSRSRSSATTPSSTARSSRWALSGGCCTAPASACACAPPARTRTWSTRQACRSRACATGRWR